jgi:hypothetical protein
LPAWSHGDIDANPKVLGDVDAANTDVVTMQEIRMHPSEIVAFRNSCAKKCYIFFSNGILYGKMEAFLFRFPGAYSIELRLKNARSQANLLLYGLVVFFSVMFTSDQMLTQIR